MDDFKPPWFLGTEGLEAYKQADNYIILDVETTNLQKGSFTNPDNELVLACWTVVKDGKVVHKYKFGNEYEQSELIKDIKEARFVVAHNAQFELGWLSRCGVDLHDVLCYCTMVGEWVIHGNLKVPLNLEDSSQRYGYGSKESLVSMLIKSGYDPADIPRSWLLKYCKIDVALCHKLFTAQHPIITEKNLWHIILSRNLTIPVLVDIQENGLQLDSEEVLKEEERLRGVIEDLGTKLDSITGGINLGSPKQLGILLYETLGFKELLDRDGEKLRTPSGGYSTAEDVIYKLEAHTEEQKAFLALYKDYNQAVTLLTKNVAFFSNVCKYSDGVFYGSIGHGRTGTHRLASSGIKVAFPAKNPKGKPILKEMSCQIQNMPRQYKKFFTSHDEDWVVLEADGAGMEFRTAAILGNDKQAESDIVNGADVHAFTRDTMNAAYEKHSIDIQIDRQEAKSSTFTPLFWGMGKDEAEAEYAKAFKEKYWGIYTTQKDWVLEVAATKQLVSPYGMIFYWPNVKMYRSGYVSNSTEIVNIPIQGLATAEIIPVALVHFWHRVRHLPVKIFNTVHDSIVSRVHKDCLDEAKRLSKIAMTTDVYNFFREVYKFEGWTGTPLGVGMKWGRSWGVGKREEIYDVWISGEERLTVEENKIKQVVYDSRA